MALGLSISYTVMVALILGFYAPASLKGRNAGRPCPAHLGPLQMLLPSEPPQPSSAEPCPSTACAKERLSGVIPPKMAQHQVVFHSYHYYMKPSNGKNLFGLSLNFGCFLFSLSFLVRANANPGGF